jgi:hypothetical protein
MLSGTTITGIQGTANNDFAAVTQVANMTLAAGTYLNVPTSFVNVEFNTTDGNVLLEMDENATTYTFDSACTFTGSNKIAILANASNIVIQTNLANSNFVTQAGGTGNYTITTPKSTITVIGLVSGSRIVLRNAGGTVVKTHLTANTSNQVLTEQYDQLTVLTYRVFAAGYKTLTGTLTLSAIGVNTLTLAQEVSDGYISSSVNIRNVNGTEQNANGIIDIDTTANTITFNSAVSLRTGLSAVIREWGNISALYNLDSSIPINLDSVSGIAITQPWTLVNDDTTSDEGYVIVSSTGAIQLLRFCFISSGNTDSIRLKIFHGATEYSDEVLSAGPINMLKTIDHTQSTISCRMEIKNPDEIFIINTETLISGGKSIKTFYKNANVGFSQITDSNITGTVRYNSSITTLVPGSRTDTDSNGVSHAFSNTFTIYNDTTTRQDFLNQIAAIMAADDSFDTKTYSFDGQKIVLPQGYQVIYISGDLVVGQLTSFIKVLDNSGVEFAFPQLRAMTVTNNGSFTGIASYAVLDTTTNSVVLDADGQPFSGTLAQGASVTRGLPISTDRTMTACVSGVGAQAATYSGTLLFSGLSLNIEPAAEIIALYTNESQTVDSSNAGTKAWREDIDDITFDWLDQVITVPDTIGECEIAYLYRAWKKQVDADPSLIRWGIALSGTNQTKPAGVTNNQHLWNPSWKFNNNWVVDVNANRSIATALQLSASGIERLDTANRNNVVYAFPLSNGSAPVLRIVVGQSEEFQVNTATALSTVTSNLEDVVARLTAVNKNVTNLM